MRPQGAVGKPKFGRDSPKIDDYERRYLGISEEVLDEAHQAFPEDDEHALHAPRSRHVEERHGGASPFQRQAGALTLARENPDMVVPARQRSVPSHT